MKQQYHPKITREVRRELFGSQAWKEEGSSMNASVATDMEL